MKFLVFNIVVLLSLGYLVTGQKNQSVGNWLDALPEKILNSYETKDLTNFLPEKQVELAQTPAKNVSEVESLVSKNVEDSSGHIFFQSCLDVGLGLVNADAVGLCHFPGCRIPNGDQNCAVFHRTGPRTTQVRRRG